MHQESSMELYEPAIQSIGCNELDLSTEEMLLFNKANEERKRYHLPPFAINWKLVQLARIKSNEMFKENYFSHISPTHGTAFEMIKKSGIKARVMGAENIGKAQTALRVHTLLMSSRDHRDNILSPLHDTIGVGVIKNDYGVFATQLFIGY